MWLLRLSWFWNVWTGWPVNPDGCDRWRNKRSQLQNMQAAWSCHIQRLCSEARKCLLIHDACPPWSIRGHIPLHVWEIVMSVLVFGVRLCLPTSMILPLRKNSSHFTAIGIGIALLIFPGIRIGIKITYITMGWDKIYNYGHIHR